GCQGRAVANFDRTRAAPQCELAQDMTKDLVDFPALGEDGTANREPHSLGTRANFYERIPKSPTAQPQSFLDCGPGSSACRHGPPDWPRACHFRNSTGGGDEELANRAIHNGKVVWRCETVFPEEPAPLGFAWIRRLKVQRAVLA